MYICFDCASISFTLSPPGCSISKCYLMLKEFDTFFMSQGKCFSLNHKAVFLPSISKIHTENFMDKDPNAK